MPALDTKVILRYIVEDDPRQTRAAQRYIEKHAAAGDSLFLATSVILEAEWVPRSVYDFTKNEIVEVFVGLLEAREMTFQDEASLERAVHRYREFNIDFADCLHVATAETFDQLPLASFERKARDIEGFEALRS